MPLPQPSSLALAVLAVGALVATVTDIRTRRIPNVLTAALSGLGLAMAATGTSGISPGAALAGCALGLMLMMPGYLLGATGAGDVKLMASIGAILGPALVITAFLFTAIAGGVLALAVATQRGRVGVTLAGTGRLIATPSGAREQIQGASATRRFAYGPAIAIGSVLAAFLG
jgi:prepilin peptidase CpaA